MKRIHVVFKTHLDVGFTDFAAGVVRRYFEDYIPRAIGLARRLRDEGRPERFIWTVGSWLIYEYLERMSGRAAADAERAIADGDLRWHALPFTMHCDLADRGLFRFGLSLSRTLDRRFGLTTIAAKMTDVPGHTRAIVPLLAEAGVRFLHIGVNPASRAPDVPDLFRWHDPPSGTEVLTMYHKGGYGNAAAVDGLDDVLAFAHTGDNAGPPSPAQIHEVYEGLRGRFPGCEASASTMDAFASRLEAVRGRLPVVTAEIGDTWVHGLGTDPVKVARFRALCRLRERWPDDASLVPFSLCLLPVPEHTWGLDVKTHLGDYLNYARPDFERARKADAVAGAVPPEYAFAAKFLEAGAPQSYSKLERSWSEQRAYLAAAVETLGDGPRATEARLALSALAPERPAPNSLRPGPPPRRIETGRFCVEVDPATGALAGLRLRRTGREWAAAERPLALLRYEVFDADDYSRWMSEYTVRLDQAWCRDWAIPDYGKPGLERTGVRHQVWTPAATACGVSEAAGGLHVTLALEFPEETSRRFGAPPSLFLAYEFPDDADAVRVTLQWFDKPASRLPEALWLSFVPAAAEPERWMMDKLGTRISPLEVASGGSRTLHGVGAGLFYDGPDGRAALSSPDVALVAMGEPRLLRFENRLPDLAGGFHFNLWNNVWGTNFPMWLEGDLRLRFELSFA